MRKIHKVCQKCAKHSRKNFIFNWGYFIRGKEEVYVLCLIKSLPLINNNNKQSFLFGPKKSGKSFLSQIWLKKNNGLELKENFELLLDYKKNVLIDELLLFDEEKIFFVVKPLLLRKIISKTENNYISISFYDHNFNEIFEKDFFSFVPIYLD